MRLYSNMTSSMLAVTLILLVLVSQVREAKKTNKRDLIEDVSDIKPFKKIVRTHTNVLAIFASSDASVSHQMTVYENVAEEIKGLATLVYINCENGKKMCKKLKASPNPVELRHYKDGEFNKVYDRRETVKSLVSFLRDPTGDMPWDEDGSAQDVVHLETRQSLIKLLKHARMPVLIMFYAPWCGFCKKMKPDYSLAASELKGEAVLAGMDVDRAENSQIRTEFNITGFPTLYYFEQGQLKYKFGGENTKDGIVQWMKDPQPPQPPKKEEEWSDVQSDVVHLTEADFDQYIETHPSVLVMFYAPWCGHCKTMKPHYMEAAAQLKEHSVEGTLAAVDATKDKKLGDKFEVKGFPTVKYFKNGKFAWDFSERTTEKMVEFMTDPAEPPPQPPADAEWSESPSDVVHLNADTFKTTLRRKKHALVMFYAPWCGHCKKAKPELMAAAEKFKDDTKVVFAALDCTKYGTTCTDNDVSGYPTFKYYTYGKDDQKYTGGREEADFVNFMKDPLNPLASAPPLSPPAETQWNDVPGHENVHHLTDGNFVNFIKTHDSVLVMFYAPWCGHCKSMKPAFGEAATILKSQNANSVLAAVDSTIEREVSGLHDVKGYPTLKYFKNGEYFTEYNLGRQTAEIVSFMTNPEKEPAPPSTEPNWSDIPSAVHHLTDDTFRKVVASVDHALIMFYTPWCSHCKKVKPDFQGAADSLAAAKDRIFGAVDCTSATNVCKAEDVKGYPTLRYFSKGKYVQEYQGGREKTDFVNFIQNPPKPVNEEL